MGGAQELPLQPLDTIFKLPNRRRPPYPVAGASSPARQSFRFPDARVPNPQVARVTPRALQKHTDVDRSISVVSFKMTSSAVGGDIVAKLETPPVKWVAVGAGVSGAAYLAMKVSWFRKNPLHSFGGKTGAMAKDLVNGGINSYNKFFDQEDGKGVGLRILSTPEFVDKFYSLITDFYEYGWGESFHFAAREIGESFEASIIRQETGTRASHPERFEKKFCHVPDWRDPTFQAARGLRAKRVTIDVSILRVLR